MGMEFGSTKRNRCKRSGLPVDIPLALFWDCKNSPEVVQIAQKTSMYWVLEIDEINGLSCVEIDRLIHDSNVLTRCIII